MILNLYLLCAVVLFFEPLNASRYGRFRRQINSLRNNGRPNDRRLVRFKDPSGSIMGATYYGVGADPNYGSYVARPNSASSSDIGSMSYNPNSNLYGYLINPNNQYQQQQQQQQQLQQQQPQQQGYLYNNYNNQNNGWQSPDTANYNNQYYNRYDPGNQGWYGTGGNYWFNKGQSIIVHPCLLLITIVILVFCK